MVNLDGLYMYGNEVYNYVEWFELEIGDVCNSIFL